MIFQKNIRQYFTITTNIRSGKFNTELLKDFSSVISNLLDDERDILAKFEKLFQGETVTFTKDDLPISIHITEDLDLNNCPNFMKPEFLHTNRTPPNQIKGESMSVHIDKRQFNKLINDDIYKTFRIITNFCDVINRMLYFI